MRTHLKSTKSLCPVCLKVIDASLIDEEGKVVIEKKCTIHGEFKDIYWSDTGQFKRFDKYLYDGHGVSNPHVQNSADCPSSCGLCSAHKTTTLLANIDVTNRCNQSCPVCFANAAASGYLYEPTVEEIRGMMQTLASEEPVRCYVVQFAGGEPTVRKDIVELVKMAKELKFVQIQIATNGVMLAKSQKLCKDLAAAGLNTIYLQFDGVTEKPYIINRGYNALSLKLKAIENCRAAGLNSICLVPTVAKGVNDNELGDIIRFAIKNNDVVKGVNFQPVSFAGRIDTQERMKKRITIPDVFRLLEEQTDGAINADDFYPVPSAVPFSRVAEAQGKGQPIIEFTVHPHCGSATYIYSDEGKIIPITRFIDVKGLMGYLNEQASDKSKWSGDSFKKIKRSMVLLSAISKYVDAKKAPKSVDVKKYLLDIIKEGTDVAIKRFHRNALFIGNMHFMDLYNMDLERVNRCGIHYATPDGRVIPFCTYNTLHRESVERKFSKPLGKKPKAKPAGTSVKKR